TWRYYPKKAAMDQKPLQTQGHPNRYGRSMRQFLLDPSASGIPFCGTCILHRSLFHYQAIVAHFNAEVCFNRGLPWAELEAVLAVIQFQDSLPAQDFAHFQAYFYEDSFAIKAVQGITKKVVPANDLPDLVPHIIIGKVQGTLLQKAQDLAFVHAEFYVPVAFRDPGSGGGTYRRGNNHAQDHNY